VTPTAVTVDAVSKKYRLYQERNSTLKASILRGRRARYEELWALRDVSLVVPQGTTFGLIGENGSGKSTLLKCMARILRPDGGTIRATGKISALLELGAGFHPELSGRENVYLNGSILGLSRRQLNERFDEIVAFAGLEHFIDAPVKNYSSGMYIRLGFSVAINVDPDILLIDEVLAVGDAEFQRRCREKFTELKSRGKTIVIVTHSLPTVRQLCDEAALLEHGVLQVVGSAAEVCDTYLEDVFGNTPDSAPEAPTAYAHIDRIEFLDGGGHRTDQLRTGSTVVVRLHYAAGMRVERPVFFVSIHTLEGTEVTRPSTDGMQLRLESIERGGSIDLRVDRLPLLPGVYDFGASLADAAVAGPSSSQPLQHVQRVTVDPGATAEEHGIVSLGAAWEIAALGARP
jgi:ABC-type polysaccharide/polyol phosphate transport system ATPase subunit